MKFSNSSTPPSTLQSIRIQASTTKISIHIHIFSWSLEKLRLLVYISLISAAINNGARYLSRVDINSWLAHDYARTLPAHTHTLSTIRAACRRQQLIRAYVMIAHYISLLVTRARASLRWIFQKVMCSWAGKSFDPLEFFCFLVLRERDGMRGSLWRRLFSEVRWRTFDGVGRWCGLCVVMGKIRNFTEGFL